MNILQDSIIEFKLEQITPMIHFQGEEEGAGIRASDLKPRFDMFLKKYWYDVKMDSQKKVLKNCILKQDEDEKVCDRISFDYKLRIINEKEDKSKKKQILCKDNRGKFVFKDPFFRSLECEKISFYREITVNMITRHKELREKISKLFPIFLAISGFGLRNNKGYGYFKIKGKTEREIIEDIKKYQELVKNYINEGELQGVGIYQLELKKNSKKGGMNTIPDDIKEFHQILKSGINHKGKYIPSLMLKVAKRKKGITPEKKIFKLFLKDRGYDISALTKEKNLVEKETYKDLDKEKKYYVRGLLGLAPFYEFRNIKRGSGGGEIKVRFVVKIKNVDRFASPIQYLPISDRKVILIVDYWKINAFRESAREAEFSLREGLKTGKQGKIENVQTIIPKEEEYSIHNLFKEGGVIEEYCKKNKEYHYMIHSDIESGKGKL